MKNWVMMIAFVAAYVPFCMIGQTITSITNIQANGGVAIDEEGNIYAAHFGPLPFVAGEEGKNLYKINKEGVKSTLVDGLLNVGTGICIDSKGYIYQGNFLGNRIYKIDDQGNIVNNEFASISGPVGLAVISNDTIVVCECKTNSLKKISQDGVIETFASGNFFSCVNGITKDGEGNLYTTNFRDGRISKINPEGKVTTLGSTTFGNGHLVYRDVDQMLYIASYSGHRIYKMDAKSGDVKVFAGSGEIGMADSENLLEATFNKPNGITISNDGIYLFITQDNNVIRKIDFGKPNRAMK